MVSVLRRGRVFTRDSEEGSVGSMPSYPQDQEGKRSRGGSPGKRLGVSYMSADILFLLTRAGHVKERRKKISKEKKHDKWEQRRNEETKAFEVECLSLLLNNDNNK